MLLNVSIPEKKQTCDFLRQKERAERILRKRKSLGPLGRQGHVGNGRRQSAASSEEESSTSHEPTTQNIGF